MNIKKENIYSMEEIKEKLSENYLKIGDYFNVSFEVLKKIVSQNKLLIGGLFLGVFILTTVNQKIIESLGVIKDMIEVGSDYYPENLYQYYGMNFLITPCAIATTVILIVIMKKAAILIEKKSKFNLIEVIKKFFIVYLFDIIVYMIVNIIPFILMITGATIFLSKVSAHDPREEILAVLIVFGIILFIYYITVCTVIWLKLLYFRPLFYLRNVKLKEAVYYNFHLCKGNRLRIILPGIILFVFQWFFFIPFQVINFITLNNFQIVFVLLSSILTTFLSIFSCVLTVVIYLNVEYMDLKKFNVDQSDDNDKIENKKNLPKNNLFENNSEN